jgi:hypothetical protein
MGSSPDDKFIIYEPFPHLDVLFANVYKFCSSFPMNINWCHFSTHNMHLHCTMFTPLELTAACLSTTIKFMYI